MAKPSKKGKGLRRSLNGSGLDGKSLDKLTSSIDKKLTSNDHKRKQPPTKAAGDQHQKRQRNSEGSASDKKGSKIDNKTLLEEIKSLGGDERDLELIQDIDSEDEAFVQDSKAVDKSLKDELAAFSKQLGFEEVEVSEASDDEEEAEEAEDDDEEEGDEDEDESEEDEEEEEETKDVIPKKVGNLAFEPRADWHAAELRKLPGPSADGPSSFKGSVEALKQYAQQLLEEDAAKYRTSVFASSSHKFLSTIMSSGTLTDKVSALTLAVQESPVHNIRAFDALMSLASKKSRGQALGAIGALVDLLGPGTLLPADRRLRTFQTQPGLLGTLQRTPAATWTSDKPLPGKITSAHLIAWIYEDWLKETYFRIIQLLESWCSDEIDYSRTRALDFVYGLLKEKPEQEANLLRLLVNKLGDRDRKISSRASYLLLQMQNSHPGMKPIIVRTIEQEILLHPSQDHRSKYYAINTLNQTILGTKEPALAETLMRIYFELFTVILKTGSLGIAPPTESKPAEEPEDEEAIKKKLARRPRKRGGKPNKPVATEPETEAADKLVSAILTGVNRAAPFMVGNEAAMESHLDTLFKIAHSANFNTGIQALLLIQQISSSKTLANDRFYKTLYESLLDPRLVTSSKQALYLNLLLRALKNDVDSRRVKAFAKRMVQIAGVHQPAFTCGLLYVVSHLRETFPDLSTLLDEPEESSLDDKPGSERPVYDGRKRDPEYSNANQSCLWEVIPLQGHYHPSVTLYASSIVSPNEKAQKPDLDSHSLIRFLDKFVYRNPKAADASKGVSIMQPLRAAKDLGDIWLGSRGPAAATPSVNSAAFWKKKAEDVAAEDIFFHEYFQQVDRESRETKKKAQAEGDGEENDEQEDEIWKALVSTQPGVDPDDEGSDVGFDLDDSDMASDAGSSPALSLDSDMGEDDDDMSVDIEGSDDEMGGAMLSEDEDGFEVKEAKSEKPKSRRRQLKDLPMFASVDDYAELLAGEEDM
ncbi:CBF domain-containing protein [Fusarium falciforme]|uniref:CBF domain-containing protein n=1 Tax=Fusarium falciforme TaxID=195108 RepID=UPI002300232A|nr:CBF domain-containing protein [Fusarium falciforme]WAO83334.1 CBF domain-containing protein [Fusarium falciforme]